jgi:hypothetical protein
MQANASAIAKREIEKGEQEIIKRLIPMDYSEAGVLLLYDVSARDREAYDEEMQKYKQYLMKLCRLSHEVLGTRNRKD